MDAPPARGRGRSALGVVGRHGHAAHAALDAEPKEPTLAECAERLVSDTTMRGNDTFYAVRQEHFDALKAALARERGK